MNQGKSVFNISTKMNEPYRFFFPLGTILILWGALIWLPLLWNPGVYPVLAHRYLMLNGFAASFIGGFLMTAVPRFSQTTEAKLWEVMLFFLVTVSGLYFAYQDQEARVFFISALQPLCLLMFIIPRFFKRKQNPPYTFIFIFAGLILWVVSGLGSVWSDPEMFKHIHYEGAVASIILGVGSRLIPGILGHVEIVSAQRAIYEKPLPLYKVIPVPFVLLVLGFIVSYFLSDLGEILRAFIVGLIGFWYWQLRKLPRDKSALTYCIWISAWLIVVSFLSKPFIQEGDIHVSHSFFINGIVLLSLMIATRVLQSHGPKDKSLENKKILFVITGLIVLAALTRVSAYYMPDTYLAHLAYSSVVLSLAILIWAYRYLRYVIK
jgi:uncharacterized protein involved in response to NO